MNKYSQEYQNTGGNQKKLILSSINRKMLSILYF